MGNQQSTPTAPTDDPTGPNRDEPDTDSTCVVSPSKPLIRKNASKSKKEADEGDRGERKKKSGKAHEKSTTGRKSGRQQQQSSGRSSKSTTSKSSSRGKTRREENVDSLELEFRRVFRGEGREKARFVSTVQETAEVPNIGGSSVRFESKQTVVNVIIPHHRTFKKKNRSKHDPWRRYGALKKLHEIGGWAFHAKDLKKNSSRRSRGVAKTRIKYYEIKKKEPFIVPPPTNQPITKLETVLVKDKKRRNSR